MTAAHAGIADATPSRRQFLAGAAGGLLLAAGSSEALAAEPTLEHSRNAESRGPGPGLGIKRQILALGNLGYFRPDIGSNDVLGILDLGSGSWACHPAATSGGHLAMALPDGGAALMPRYDGLIDILDTNWKSRGVLQDPAMAFSGHAIEWNGSLWLAAEPMRGKTSEKPATEMPDEGCLLELDLATLAFGRTIRTGGVHPHDMVHLGGSKVAVSHYGITWQNQVGEGGGSATLMFEAPKPIISVIDLATGTIDRTFDMPANGASTHIAQGGDGRIYVLPLQYSLLPSQNDFQSRAPLGAILRQDEWKNLRVAHAMPIQALDLQSGEIQEIDLGVRYQRRGQSIACNKRSGRIIVTYPYSDSIVIHDPRTGTTAARRAFDFGLHAVRGVCDIPDTNWVALSGEWEGIVVIDTEKLAIVGRYAMPTSWCVHISAS